MKNFETVGWMQERESRINNVNVIPYKSIRTATLSSSTFRYIIVVSILVQPIHPPACLPDMTQLFGLDSSANKVTGFK